MTAPISIVDLVTRDPGLPRTHPTQSYWQRDPHALATTQSATLPEQTDYAIIGSGITGLAVSLTLLENHPSASVTVLEARTLCSGATGRNGGQLAANAGEEYAHLAQMHGGEMAGKIVHFTFDNLKKMRELVRQYAPEECDLEDVQKLRVFLTEDSFAGFQQSIAQMEQDHPSLRGIYTVLDRDQLKRQHHIDGAGGCLLAAGTIWPYKLVTSTFASLLEKYASRFSIETNTAVTSVAYEASGSHPYVLQTARGRLHAGKVAYCTNGYTGHLLPNLRGAIYPLKGTMTVQDPGHAMANQGHELSWGFHYPARYDAETQRYAAGLYYLFQHAQTGHFYFGGEDTQVDQCLSADDSHVGDASVTQLQDRLPPFLGCSDSERWDVVSAWSGIMGFTADGLPVVGPLPASWTGRNGTGEYIAAAFKGYGMPNCLLSGEALAKMMLGEEVRSWFPEAYGVDARRMARLTAEQVVAHFQ